MNRNQQLVIQRVASVSMRNTNFGSRQGHRRTMATTRALPKDVTLPQLHSLSDRLKRWRHSHIRYALDASCGNFAFRMLAEVSRTVRYRPEDLDDLNSLGHLALKSTSYCSSQLKERSPRLGAQPL